MYVGVGAYVLGETLDFGLCHRLKKYRSRCLFCASRVECLFNIKCFTGRSPDGRDCASVYRKEAACRIFWNQASLSVFRRR